MTAIYKITSPSNHVYIGQSTNVQDRWKHYRFLDCVSQPRLYNSLKKYGPDNHTFEIEFELRDDVSQPMLNYWEQFFMDHYRSEGHEMLNLKGAGSNGKHSEETKRKIGDGNRGKVHNQAFRDRTSARFKGKKLPPSQLANIAANKKILKGAEHPLFGKPVPRERVMKTANALRGRKRPQHVIERVRAARSKFVICLETGQIFPSADEASLQLFGKRSGGSKIGLVCNGKRKQHRGLTFSHNLTECVKSFLLICPKDTINSEKSNTAILYGITSVSPTMEDLIQRHGK